MALDAKWNDDLDLARVIQTPKVGLGPFISQPEIPVESFNPMGYSLPGLGECSVGDSNDDLPRLCQSRGNDQETFRPKLSNPLPLPHPLDISAIIHNRDCINGVGLNQPIDLDEWPYEIVRRSLIELPTPFGFGKAPSLFSDDENDPEEEESTIRKSLNRGDTEEEASASSCQASAEDTPLVLRSAASKHTGNGNTGDSINIGSPMYKYNGGIRMEHSVQQQNQLSISDVLDVNKQKKLSTIASESDVGLNTEDAISAALESTHNEESDFYNKDCSLNDYGEVMEVDPEMASLTKSLEELDRDLIVDGPGKNESFSIPPSTQKRQTNDTEVNITPLSINTAENKLIDKGLNNEKETLEQRVRREMKERDKRDAELVSAAVFSSINKNGANNNSNLTKPTTVQSPRKQKYSLDHRTHYYNHNLHFPPIANYKIGKDHEEGQGCDPALDATNSKVLMDYPNNEHSGNAESTRTRSSAHLPPRYSMGRRSTSTSGVDEPPQVPIRHAYQRSYSHSRSTRLPESTNLLLNSTFNALSQDRKNNSKSADILENKDSTSKNPDSYSTVV